MKTSGVVKMIHSNDFPRYIPLEHTPNHQPILYEGIPFIRGGLGMPGICSFGVYFWVLLY